MGPLSPWGERPLPLPPAHVDYASTAASGLLADRVRGMLLGVAIGDSLGNTSESMLPGERRELFGEIRDYLPHPREDQRPIGFPSDDTQMTFWTVESLLRRGFLDPEDLAESFVGPRIFGIGKTVTDFLFAYRFQHKSWDEAGQSSADNGALMRITPVLLPHLGAPSETLWRDVITATVLTNRDEAAVAAGVGFVGLLYECLGRAGVDAGALREAPAPEWWVERFLHYARPVETAGPGETTAVYTARVPGDPFRGSLCDRVEQMILPVLESGASVREAGDLFYSGAYLLETVPSVLHTLALHAADPEEALVRAVNDTRDNDTIASIVGAAVGALHGREAFPARWQEPLLGRTVEDDDGHVQELIEQAVQRFVVPLAG